jgi:hypothetical protein
MLEMLAEIVQEFCQPLSVVNCSLDVVKASTGDTMPDSVKTMIDMASESTERLVLLIEQLKNISGMPSHILPDEKLIETFYKKD